jgi:hypothetical protein
MDIWGERFLQATLEVQCGASGRVQPTEHQIVIRRASSAVTQRGLSAHRIHGGSPPRLEAGEPVAELGTFERIAAAFG